MNEQTAVNADKVAFVTPSYLPDLRIVEDLSASLDRHYRSPFTHYILVPNRDLKKFRHLESQNRKVLSTNDLLRSFGIFQLPTPRSINLPGIRKNLNTNWWKLGFGRLSGWTVQQIVKMAAPSITDAETIVCVDSDVILRRDVTSAIFYTNGKLRLHAYDGPLPTENHKIWRRKSIAIFGIDAAVAGEEGFIGNLITWKRANLLLLQRKMEEVSGKKWYDVIAREKFISEYMLYGYFNKYVLSDNGGHHLERFTGVHSLWNDSPDEWARFRSNLSDDHVAVHIQSTITKDVAYRRSLIAELDRA